MSSGRKRAEFAAYGLIAGAVFLAWEIVKAPIAVRAPPAMAVRVASASEEVLQRAAEAELLENRVENAEALAREALKRGPFNARSLRVLGLANARAGQNDAADEMLTLAGNWSLRDDPAHAWLIERRLRQGNYSSAFGHADTLARRREDTYQTVFDLYATSALTDPRSIGPLSETLNRRPPWRDAFLRYLLRRSDTDPVAYAIAVAMERQENKFSDLELRVIYLDWLGERRFPAMHLLREGVGRPASDGIQDGEFSIQPDLAMLPFGWNILSQKGFFTALTGDDLREGNSALRVEYDGYSSGTAAEQILMLGARSYRLEGEYRSETSSPDSRLTWTVHCMDNGQQVASWPLPVASSGISPWRKFNLTMTIPDANCTVQTLRLQASPQDRRDVTVAWFDKFRIEPAR